MRVLSPFSRGTFRSVCCWGAVCVLVGLGAGMAAGQSCTTTVTGKVYSPLGPAKGDPIPNILVYIPQTAVLPFAASVGAGVTGGCSAQANLVSGNPLVNATTDAAGNFTLVTTGLTTGTYNLVIQAGKWRRQYPNTAITACATNNIDTQYGGGLTMPSTTATTDGTIADLPHIAVVTGEADSIECIFHQIGIADSEVTDPSGTGSINLFRGASDGGEYANTSTSAPTEVSLVGSPATLANYDVVIFGCQGTTSSAATSANQQNMVNYANAGGRIFATHYAYNWLDTISPFSSSAVWNVSHEVQLTGTFGATIDQSYAEGVILAQWLQNIGASNNGVQGQIALQSIRIDTSAVNNPPAQNWVRLNSGQSSLYTGTPSMQFTFNTPVGSTGVPTLAVNYTNTTTLFEPGDTADSVVVNVTNSSSADATNTLVLTIAMPGSLTATSAVDTVAGTSGWTCAISGGGATVTCSRTTPLAAGASDSVALTFSIAGNATVGQSTITSSLAGGNISSTGQCGRVLYNDYHVETNGSGKYPEAACLTALTPQERFLEFSLYNLSNFVAPVDTDVILIEGTPVITWATPAAMPYGVALGGTQLDATASYAGTALAGTFAYSPAAGTVLPLGTSTLGVTFTPTDTTDYTTATGQTTVQVVADTTTVTLTSGTNPSYLGQSVTFSAAVGTNGAVAAGQTVNFFDGLTQIGTSTTNAQGVATYTLSGLIVGNHTMTACVVGSADFNASCSAPLIQLVTLIPTPPLTTSSVLTSNANPSFVGQTVTFTVGVATTGAFTTIPTGTVTFYDGATSTTSGKLLGTGTLGANGFATFSTSTLALGTHSITAVYGGTSTLATSTSNAVLQVVLVSLPTAGSGFLLTVNPINVSLAVGTSQVVNVQVLSLNNFQQTVTLSCTGNFPGNGCVLGKTLMPVGGGTTTLTLTAVAPAACGSSTGYFSARSEVGGRLPLLALGGLGLGMLFARRRRRLRRLMQGLTLVLGLCVLPMMTGCGGKCTDLGTQPGAYTLTVTAVSGGTSPTTQTQEIVVNVHL